MQDLFAKVQTVNTDLVFPSFAPYTHFPWLQDSPRFAVLPRGLKGNITLSVPVKHSEEVVVGPCHDDTAREKENKESQNVLGEAIGNSIF